jgi:flagellar motor switch protein FliM
MSESKANEDKPLSKEMYEQALSDFRIEQEDEIKVRKAGLKQVKMRRPPRTSREAVETLKEADERYKRAQ